MEVELAKQLDELYVVFGLRCLSVLRYLTDHIGVLSLGVLARSFSKFAQKLSTFVWYVQNDYNWWSRHGLFKIVFETLNILSTVTSLHINSKIDSVFKIFKKEIQFINFARLTRFVRVHDLPGLLAAALQNQPWRRNGWKHFSQDLVASPLWGFEKRWVMRLIRKFSRYNICIWSSREVWRDGLWTKEDDEEMVIEKMEAQAWICLYNLLSTREVAAF